MNYKILVFTLLFGGMFLYGCSTNSSIDKNNQKPTSNLEFGKENTQFRNTETKNLSPYAMFGDSSFVLMTEQERNEEYYLEYINSKNGSILAFDLSTNRVYFLTSNRELECTLTLPITSVTRFLSVDPHSKDYAGWNPYNFVANNPLNVIDPDGRDWVIVHDKEKNHYTFSFRGKILNETGKDIENLQNVANEMLLGLAEVFTGKGEGAFWSFDMENSYLQVATSEDQLLASDHAIRIVSEGSEVGGRKLGGGKAAFGSQAIYLNESVLENKEVKKGNDPVSRNWNARGLTDKGQLLYKYIFAHEAGHTGYLPHIQEDKRFVGEKDYIPLSYFDNYETGNNATSGKNIMSDYDGSLWSVAPLLTPRQIQTMNRRYEAGMLNNGKQKIEDTAPVTFVQEY
jgi:hypothetical protein